MFPDSAFENSCVLLDNELNSTSATSNEWEFVFESEGFKISKRPINAAKDLFEYKAVGFIASIPPETVCKVYMDSDMRKKYDTQQGQVSIAEVPISRSSSSISLNDKTVNAKDYKILYRQRIEWTVKYPWPMKDRIYAFDREVRKILPNDTVIIKCLSNMKEPTNQIAAKSFEAHKNYIKTTYPKSIIVEDYRQDWIFCKHSQIVGSLGKMEGTLVIMVYFEDGGAGGAAGVPSTVVQWGLQRGIPNYIKSLTLACQEYHSQSVNHGQKLLLESPKSSILKTAEMID